MFYIYILHSKKFNKYYTGITEQIDRRLKEHNQGQVKSTKPYLSWRLIYYEACLNKNDALRREKYLKTTQGQRLLKRRLKDYFYKIK